MGITPAFSESEIRNQVQMQAQRIEAAIINRLKYLGEQCVNVARENGSYLNQTGNLRNSIGYVVYANGQKVEKNFEHVATGNSQVDALQIAENYADQVAGTLNISSDYVLIVVAGMEYASTVESRGRDVLTSAEQYAERNLPRMIDKLNANINAMQK